MAFLSLPTIISDLFMISDLNAVEETYIQRPHLSKLCRLLLCRLLSCSQPHAFFPAMCDCVSACDGQKRINQVFWHLHTLLLLFLS